MVYLVQAVSGKKKKLVKQSYHSKNFSCLILSMWNLEVYMPVWVFSSYSGYLPQTKNMHIGLIGDFKLPQGASVRQNDV